MADAARSHRPARRRWHLLLVGLAAAGCADAGAERTEGAERDDRPITILVAPHPDDEFQAWGSLPDDRQAGDVVHVFLTQGEQTAFCEAGLPGFDERTGEHRPDPVPMGRFTPSCREARINSTLRFLERMADVDASSPVAEPVPAVAGPFPTRDVTLCRFDGDEECRPVAPTVDVHAAADASPVLFFDLGDGDLTAEEVEWALRTIVTHRDALGLDPSRPFGDLVAASYATAEGSECYVYEHPDHHAVAEVVRGTDFEAFSAQVVPVCASEDDAVSAPVAPELFDAAFAPEDGGEVGHHVAEYGWLLDPFWPGDPGPGQSTLFHADQWFVRQFARAPGGHSGA